MVFLLSLKRLLSDLTIYMYMSNAECVLQKAGTTYPSRASVFTPGFGVVRVAHLFSILLCFALFCFFFFSFFFCVFFFFFFCLFPVSCMPSVTSRSGLSILDCPFGFF